MSSKKILLTGGLIIAGFGILFLTVYHNQIYEYFQRSSQSTVELNPEADNVQKKESVKKYPKATFDLQLINSKGENVDFEDFKGKVIFMNMWATWCAPCVEEMPGINRLYNKTKNDEQIEMVMISHDQNFETAKNFIQKNDYDFEIYKVNGRFPKMYNAGNLPATYVINAEGELVVTHLGMGEYDTREFQKFLTDLK